MAKIDEEQGGNAGNESVVVGLVKRVMGVEKRLVLTRDKVFRDKPTPAPPRKGNVQVGTKVMDSPRKKNTSIRTMSDFKI